MVDANVANELRQCKNVDFGNKSFNDMSDYYNGLDCMLNCSKSEAVASTTVESICCGTPVITTPVGYSKNIIIDKANGFFVKPDITEYKKAIEYFAFADYDKIFKLNAFVAQNILDFRLLISYVDLAFEDILKSRVSRIKI